MNRFSSMIENFVLWGRQNDDLYAAFMIGSQAREDHPADQYSDLDLVMVVENPDDYLLSDSWLEQIGKFHISFTEDTVGGAKERRILFEHALDVDFVILPKSHFNAIIGSGEIGGILERGCRILIDKMGIRPLLPAFPVDKPARGLMAEAEFINIVNDFWYHTVWTAKKLVRGELWTAKMCVDSYMKWKLLALIECRALIQNGLDYDVWHNGRFLEEWADERTVQTLSGCFSHYEKEDMARALLCTMDLFRLAASEIADKLHYDYPKEADEYASAWVSAALQ